MHAVPAVQKQQALSRRTLMVGGVGLVVGGGIAWFALSQKATEHNTGANGFNPPQLIGNNPQNFGPDKAELTYSGHKNVVMIVGWSPDGKYIASGSMDGTAQVWSATRGETDYSIVSTVQPRQSDDYVWSLAWSPHNNEHLAVSFVDGTIQILDASNKQRFTTRDKPPGGVPLLTWSPDEKYLAVGESDNTVRVYDITSWNAVTTYQEHTNSIKAIAWSPDGRYIASGAEDTTVRMWEPLSGQTKLVYKEHSNAIVSVDWSHDSTHIVSSAADQTARVWDVGGGTTQYVYHTPGGGPLGEARWSHNDHTIAIYGGNAKMYLLEAKTGKVIHSIFTGVVYSISWSPDDTHIVTGNYDNAAHIWRVGV